MQNPIVTFEMENGKKIKLELYPDAAPITVKNFEKLVSENKVCAIMMETIQGEVVSPIEPAPGCRFSPRCKYACEQFHQEQLHSKREESR